MVTCETKTISIRLPEEMNQKITEIIETKREYSSTPDYIVSAIRRHADALEGVTETILNEFEETEGGELSKAMRFMMFMLSLKEEVYENYEPYKHMGGKPRTILIRCPEGLLSRIIEINEYIIGYKNIQEFIRCSIAESFRMEQHNAIGRIIDLRVTVENVELAMPKEEQIKRIKQAANKAKSELSYEKILDMYFKLK